MSYLTRTISNFLKIGPREYLRQLNRIGDTKFGTFIGIDQFGNKYFENNEEFFGRERWVEYGTTEYDDASQIPPEWQPLPLPKYKASHVENPTLTRKAYKPYNTTAPKIIPWEPKISPRS
nr:1674_t:CDS:2 [Entrophospora candida]CAG8570690.1 6358_t:CDS:2 [Entrophospora candida]